MAAFIFFSGQEIQAFVYFSVESDTSHNVWRDVHIKDIESFRLL